MTSRSLSIALAALLAATGASAADIYRCEVDGHVTFSQTPCTGAVERIEVDINPTGTGGLRPGEAALLDQVKTREAEDRRYKRFKYDQDDRYHVGYSDRKRIKNLERERRRLQDSLSDDASVGKSWAIKSEIDGINRQIEQLRAPKW